MHHRPLPRKTPVEVLLPAIAKVLDDTAACGLRRRAADAAEGSLISQLIDREWLCRRDGRLCLTREGEAERRRLTQQLRPPAASRTSFTGSPF